MNKFEVISDFKPQGDQPKAIRKLKNGIKNLMSLNILK